MLDIGCGDGDLSEALACGGAEVTGIDADPEMVSAATRRLPSGSFLCADALALPFDDGRFDLVVMVTLLCHVQNRERAVAEAGRVLRPGGRLLVGELGRRSVWAFARRLKGWQGDDFWRTARFFTAAELAGLAKTAGLTVERVGTAVYYPPNGWAASLLAPLDRHLARLTTFGAAFIAVAARKPG